MTPEEYQKYREERLAALNSSTGVSGLNATLADRATSDSQTFSQIENAAGFTDYRNKQVAYDYALADYNRIGLSLKDDGGLQISIPDWVKGDQEVMDQINNLAQIKVKFNADGTATHPLFNDLEGLNKKLSQKKFALDVSASDFGGNFDAGKAYAKNASAIDDRFATIELPSGDPGGFTEMKYDDFVKEFKSMSDEDKSRAYSGLTFFANGKDQVQKARAISLLKLLEQDSAKPLSVGALTNTKEFLKGFGASIPESSGAISAVARIPGIGSFAQSAIEDAKALEESKLELPTTQRISQIGGLAGSLTGSAGDIVATQGIGSGTKSLLEGTKIAKKISSGSKIAETLVKGGSAIAGEIAQGATLGFGKAAAQGKSGGYSLTDLAIDATTTGFLEFAPKTYRFLKRAFTDNLVGDMLAKNNTSTLGTVVSGLTDDLNDTLKATKIDDVVSSGRFGENAKDIVGGAEHYKALTKLQIDTSASQISKANIPDDEIKKISEKLGNGEYDDAQKILDKYDTDLKVSDLKKLDDTTFKADDLARKASYKPSGKDSETALGKIENYTARSAVTEAVGEGDNLRRASTVAGSGGKKLSKTIGSDLSRTFDSLVERAKELTNEGKTLVGVGLRENIAARTIETTDRLANVAMFRKLEQDGAIIREASGKRLKELTSSGRDVGVFESAMDGVDGYKVAYATPEWLTANGYKKNVSEKVGSFLNSIGQKVNSPAWVKGDVLDDLERTYSGVEEVAKGRAGRFFEKSAKVSSFIQNLKLSAGFRNLNSLAYNETVSMLAAAPEKAPEIIKDFVVANSSLATQKQFLDSAEFLAKFKDTKINKIKIPKNVIEKDPQLLTLSAKVSAEDTEKLRRSLSEAKDISNAIANKAINGDYGLSKKASAALDKLQKTDPTLFTKATNGELSDTELIKLYDGYLSNVKNPSAKLLNAQDTLKQVGGDIKRINADEIKVGSISEQAFINNGLDKSKASQVVDAVNDVFEKLTGEATFDNYIPLLQLTALKSAYGRAIKLGLSEQDAIKAAAKSYNKYFVDGSKLTKLQNDILTTFFMAPQYRRSQVLRWGSDIASIFRVINAAPRGELKRVIAENSLQLTHAMMNVLALAGISAVTKVTYDKFPWEIKGAGSAFAIPLVGDDGKMTIFDPIGMQTSTVRIAGRLGQAILKGESGKIFDEAGSFASLALQPAIRLAFNSRYGGGEDFGKNIRNPDDPAAQQLQSAGGYAISEYLGHPFIKAFSDYVNTGNGRAALFQTLELPIREKDALKAARNGFNFDLLPAVEGISEDYAKQISQESDDAKRAELQAKMFEDIKELVNNWKESYGGVLKDVEVNPGTKGIDLNDVQKQNLLKKAYGKDSTNTSFTSDDTLAQQQEISAYSTGLNQLADQAKGAGLDLNTLLTELKGKTSKYYGASDELAFQYERAFKKNKDTGEVSFGEIKNNYSKLLDDAYKAKDFKAVEKIQNDYLKEFDARVKPLIDQYGIESLYQNRNIQRELADYLVGFVPYKARKDAGLKGKTGQLDTADTLQFLKERYGVGGRDKSNLPSDQSIQEGIQRINTSLSNGKIGSAQALARSLLSSVNRGIMGASEEDYNTLSSVINIKES